MASKLVIIIVFILDLIAVGLAIAAEQRRSVVRIILCLSRNLSLLVCAISCSESFFSDLSQKSCYHNVEI